MSLAATNPALYVEINTKADKLDSVALASEKKGDLAAASSKLKASFQTRYRTGDAANPKMMNTLHKLSSVLTQQNKYDEAEKYLNWCLKAKNQAHGAGSVEFASTYQAMGKLNLAQQNYKKAIHNFNSASVLYEKYTGATSPQTLDAKKQLANAYLKAGDNVKYEQLMATTTHIASVPAVDKVDEVPAVNPDNAEAAAVK